MQRKKPILWLSGGPGAGKSFLSSNIIQYLVQRHPQGVQDPRRVSVAYFFCKDYDPELRSFNKALRSLAYQICLNDPVYAKHCTAVFKSVGDLSTVDGLWKNLFVEFFRKDAFENAVLFLIDGLDEAFKEDRDKFLDLLQDLQGQANAGVSKLRMQLVLVGRPELDWDIEETLDDRLLMISVSMEKTSKDISEYIQRGIGKVGRPQNFRLQIEPF